MTASGILYNAKNNAKKYNQKLGISLYEMVVA